MLKGALYQLDQVHKTYYMGEVAVPVLHGVDLTLYEGELAIVVGASGSGKSTLLNLIGGMDCISDGKLQFRDLAISDLDDAELTLFRRESIGFVFQFFNLVPTLTAIENVEVAANLCDEPKSPREMLELVGLGDRLDHFPSQLSGGEQQRVAIARALVKSPEVLLCDEPTGSLDLEMTVQILELLQKLNRELGTTIVLITHELPVRIIGHRVVHLGDGIVSKVDSCKNPAEVKEIKW